MTKKEYIDKLTKELGSMSYNDVKDILSDIENHFDESIEAGKTEEEAASMLGDPVQLASDYKEGMTLPVIIKKNTSSGSKPKAKEPTSATVMFVLLITIFIAIPSWVVLFGIVLSMVLIELACVAGAVALLCTCWFYGGFMVSGLLAGLTLLFFSVFGFAVSYFAVKYFVKGTKWYIGFMKNVWHNGI